VVEEDANHNKGIMIEIFDNKKAPQKEVSLAEMFKTKKRDMLQDQQVPGQNKKETDQDNLPAKKQEKTKEELAELRKAMMKSKFKKNQDNCK